MRAFVLLLSCLACVGSAREVLAAADSSKSLAMLLHAANPRAAFNAPGPLSKNRPWRPSQTHHSTAAYYDAAKTNTKHVHSGRSPTKVVMASVDDVQVFAKGDVVQVIAPRQLLTEDVRDQMPSHGRTWEDPTNGCRGIVQDQLRSWVYVEYGGDPNKYFWILATGLRQDGNKNFDAGPASILRQMWSNRDRTGDVILVGADAKEIQAHAAILSAVSPVFAGAFTGETAKNKTGKVVVNGMASELITGMLEWIYTGFRPAKLPLDDALSFAYKYQLVHLIPGLGSEALRQMSPDNSVKIGKFLRSFDAMEGSRTNFMEDIYDQYATNKTMMIEMMKGL